MALSIIGIPLLRNIDKELMWSSLAILLMHVYIVFSWWCWYYGDSLSIRPMIDIYPFLAVSLAAFLAWALRQNGWIMTVIVIILGFFMLNNRVQHIQYADQKLSGSAMTLTAFSELFFNPKYDGDLDIVGAYKYPDTESLRAGLEERIEFDTIFGLPRLDTTFSDFIKVSDEMYYSPTWEVPYDLFKTELKSDFILVELMLDGEKDNYENARLVASFNKGESSFDYRQVRLGIVANQHYVLRKPRNLPEGGVLQLYLWQKGVGSFNLEGMSVSQVQISYSKRSLENY